MSLPARWVLASANAGKLREFADLLAPAGLSLQSLAEAGLPPPPEEAATFIENALAKARHAAAGTGLAAIADDSGLIVDALDGAPGVHSARYAGAGAGDGDNVTRLLGALDGVPAQRRTARFVCVLVALRAPADPDPLIARGVWHGRIVPAPRGGHGFGYDPVFEPVQTPGRTAAELAPAEKHALSHRGLASRRLLELLRAYRDGAHG